MLNALLNHVFEDATLRKFNFEDFKTLSILRLCGLEDFEELRYEASNKIFYQSGKPEFVLRL